MIDPDAYDLDPDEYEDSLKGRPMKKETIARAIASALGDDYDDVPRHKQELNRRLQDGTGYRRDVNQPFQGDYDSAALDALEAITAASYAVVPVEPTEAMIDAADAPQYHKRPYARVEIKREYGLMITAAQEEDRGRPRKTEDKLRAQHPSPTARTHRRMRLIADVIEAARDACGADPDSWAAERLELCLRALDEFEKEVG